MCLDGEKNELSTATIRHDTNRVNYDKSTLEEGHIFEISSLNLPNQMFILSLITDALISTPEKFSTRLGDFVIEPTGRTIQGIIFEGGGASKDITAVFYPDTLLFAYDSSEGAFLDNCQIDAKIPNSEFEFPSS